MALNIKASGTEGMALQVTSQAKKAGLVQETTDEAGERSYTYKAEVRVFGFPGLLLVVDREKMDAKHVVELVTTVANDIDAIETAGDATVTRAGGGVQVQLPPAENAGFHVGDTAPCRAIQNGLLIRRSESPLDHKRLVGDIVEIRKSQRE